jgi:hypothetical protein
MVDDLGQLLEFLVDGRHFFLGGGVGGLVLLLLVFVNSWCFRLMIVGGGCFLLVLSVDGCWFCDV